MNVDWVHADEGTHMFIRDIPAPGGQSLTVPEDLADVDGDVTIHTDIDTGDRYASVGGTVTAHAVVEGEHLAYFPDYPDWQQYDYWPYRFTGWPIIAAIPGDIYNAELTGSEATHEFGGKVIECFAKHDPDWPGPYLQTVPFHTNPPEPLGRMRPGDNGPGGQGQQGGYAADGVTLTEDTGWNVIAVSQRCWVLILVDPSGHRFYHDPNVDENPEYVSSFEGLPVVFEASGGGLSGFFFSLIWKLGVGSAGGSGVSGVPSTVVLP